ncbi:MAG: glucosamine-6-phosphate deaminase [Cyanobacteriota bacterium]|nr:glucosamine-6-phosphate deaminase [Cyanobacteriota bacterium]
MPPCLAPAVEVLPDAAAVAQRAAALLIDPLCDPQQPPTGLATGRTMEPVYGALCERLRDDSRYDPHGWRSFNLDEYVGLTAQDPRSFGAYMQHHLGRPLGLPLQALQLPDGAAADPAAEAARYGEAVRRRGLGLQLLGLGSNGHVGFNEPPCAATAPCRVVQLSGSTRRQNAGAFGGDPASVPVQAITLGLAEILAARELLLVVLGAAKAGILRRALQEPAAAELPASWLQGHPRVRVVCDREAAAQLD